jgi:hypothetical protein
VGRRYSLIAFGVCRPSSTPDIGNAKWLTNVGPVLRIETVYPPKCRNTARKANTPGAAAVRKRDTAQAMRAARRSMAALYRRLARRRREPRLRRVEKGA